MNALEFLAVGSLAITTLGVVGSFLTTAPVAECAGEADPSETVTTLDQLAKDLRSLTLR